MDSNWGGTRQIRVKSVAVTSGGSAGVCRFLWDAARTYFREEPALRHSDVFPTLAVGEIRGV